MAKRKRLKSRRTRVMVVIGFIIVIAVAAYFVYRAYAGESAPEVTYTTGTVEKMTLTSSISGTGNVALSNAASVSAEVSGEVSGLSVAVGDTVEAGQVLFTIVNPELDLAVTSAENSYDQAVLNLSKAELSVLQAKQSLEDLEEQYAAQSTSTTAASTTSTVHTPSTQPSTTTTAPASTTTTSYPATTTTVTVAPSSTGSAQALLTEAAASGTTGTGSSGTTSKITYLDIKAAKQSIESAELSVTSAQTQVTEAQMAVETAKENAAKRTVAAPISGTITTLDLENGDTVGSSSGSSGSSGGGQTSGGTSDSSSSSAMTITNLDSFTASITLAEADISSVELGQKAVITFDALPDLTLTGKVTSIDTTGTNSQGVVSYSVVITPDITDKSVKGGMTVSVNIITQVATDVLAVPSTAVKSQGTDGTSYVQILENGTPSNVTVETGMSTDSYTEITSGLTEGQEIIVQTATASAGNTTTSQRNSSGGLLGTEGGMPSGGPPSGGGGFSPPGQ
jgi:multidrug efflux pump subunit AcrA (membrane-fusion protein)